MLRVKVFPALPLAGLSAPRGFMLQKNVSGSWALFLQSWTAEPLLHCIRKRLLHKDRFTEIQKRVGNGLAKTPQGRHAWYPPRAGDLTRQCLLLQSPRGMLFLHASQNQDKIFFSKFDTEQETKQQMMAPLHTLSKAGGASQSSLWLQEKRNAATVQPEPLNRLFENAMDVCCDNSAPFKMDQLFQLRLLVPFSHCVSAESGQNRSIYKDNITAGVTDTDDT